MKESTSRRRIATSRRPAVGTFRALKKHGDLSDVSGRIREHVFRFKNGSTLTLRTPTADSQLLRELVAAIEGLSSEVGYQERAVGEADAAPVDDRLSAHILATAAKLSGSKAKAQNWYRSFQIPAFGGVTAEFLVEHGRAKEVRDYLNAVVLGEFA